MDWSTGQTLKAAFLVYQGHPMDEASWEEDECVFWFQDSEGLRHDLKRLMAGRALVEPKRFNQVFGGVRKAMFNHPDAPRNRRATAAG